jgi:hypothetical protein
MTVFDRRDLRPGFSMSGERYEIGMLSVDHRWDVEPVRVEVPAALERR